ncbi:hypothetical protein GWR56_19705 [Mucilaginibacter sp. 14171R-50]|uniref:hypothetical protein n=1 Tax=Mucilaginibacter sp. 14171R-50 TaxID=2703789 RepID=UPI00138CC740|nr:hypothetical protein [Mucilaginibacter sp. 14171R-50]QHS57660.1 hypothetical protein GWR56_19705 [Mucilaginibacter sp. 14171R-50]
MKNWVKISLISIGIFGIIILMFFIYVSSMFWDIGSSDETYNAASLIENFNNKQTEIYNAKKYFKSIVPKYKEVEIEFEGDKIERLVIMPQDTGRGSNTAVEFQDWNIPIKSAKADSLLKVLGWSDNSLQTLRNKLDDANCISITSAEPSQIGFKRSGMGMYYFNVFDKPIPDSLKSRYNDSCTYIYANKHLVLEYGGGAIGPQCFGK